MGLGKASQVLFTASLLPAARGAAGDARGAAGNVRETPGDTRSAGAAHGAAGSCPPLRRAGKLPVAQTRACFQKWGSEQEYHQFEAAVI